MARGGYLVTARDLSEEDHDRALAILDVEGAVDIDDRVASWRDAGWTGWSDDAPSSGPQAPRPVQAGFAETPPGIVPKPDEAPDARAPGAPESGRVPEPQGRFAEQLSNLPEADRAAGEADRWVRRD